MNGGINGHPPLNPGRYRGVFKVAQLPVDAALGDWAFAPDCRVFNGAGTQESGAAGTGGHVSFNGTAWKIAGTNVTAVA